MPDSIQKLRPDRDLQCFYFQPTAIAALSNTSPRGFTLSGTWRQQTDWAVIEWNRDNVYEHPTFRNLPDGDLSGLVLSYEETRTNCIPLDSKLFATVDWPSLRIWVSGRSDPYYLRLADYATPIAGGYADAYADFTLSGSGIPEADTYVGIAYLETHYTYQFNGSATISDSLTQLQTWISPLNTVQPPLLDSTLNDSTLRVFYRGSDPTNTPQGANGNRFGMYTYSTTPAATWDADSKTFANGTSPTTWKITIDFNSLTVYPDNTFAPGSSFSITGNEIRKLRWTYAADLQTGNFERTEFKVVVSNWSVTGTNSVYSVAGPGSRRVESDSSEIIYNPSLPNTQWTYARGNFSGGTIHYSTTPGNSITWNYQAEQSHTLYLGTRYLGLPSATGAAISIEVDGASLGNPVSLVVLQEDVLIRLPLGTYQAGGHSVTVTHSGSAGEYFYFDFFELAVPTTNLPTFPAEPQFTLATDWDTLHSLSIAPERTAWFINSLGFTGRQNHYVGALWFYELTASGFEYASIMVTFSGVVNAVYGDATHTLTLTIEEIGSTSSTAMQKVMHPGDTPNTVAIAFAEEINSQSAIWASASSGVLTITSRVAGSAGNNYTLAIDSENNTGLSISVSTTLANGVYPFAGGQDGNWYVDLAASPRLNRGVRDWTSSFCVALKNYGIDMAASFSMELGNGDPSVAAGIAQRDPNGNPIKLPTPSLQTNFSPASLAFWQEVYAEMANIQASAGLTPFLQFGEVQWWYFPNNGLYPTDPQYVAFAGMPFYDAWTQTQFQSQYGRPMTTFADNTANLLSYPDEAAFLPSLIGNFTTSIMSYVRATQPSCRFEVLYPTDVNQTAFNAAINFPASAWTPSTLTVLKTECFGFTLGRDLNQSEATIDFGQSLGFSAAQRSQLTGVGDSTTAWLKEAQIAAGKRFESVVLFALDQYCLIGYETPLPQSFRRSLKMGN